MRLLLSTLALGVSAMAQDPGKELFEKRCAGCHAIDRDKEGPRLGKVYGRGAGSVESFEYSTALRNSKLSWNDESLDAWLTDPEKLVPQNDMAYRLVKPDERRAIIDYLKKLSAR
jgi:cytochrome c